MATKDDDERPITVGDIKRWFSNYRKTASPLAIFLGSGLIVIGIISLLIPGVDNVAKIALALILGIFGLLSIYGGFWIKNRS